MMMAEEALRIGVGTVSDRAASGGYPDLSGPAILDFLGKRMVSSWQAVQRIIPDDRDRIEEVLIELAEQEQCSLIFTTGGTGPAKRDVTPEAVEAVCSKWLPGFGEKMRAAAWDRVPTAILSRQVAGIRGGTLIMALPGNPSAVQECLEAVFLAIPHCLELLEAPRMEIGQN
jgi:molybdopterin adenylyltransferase